MQKVLTAEQMREVDRLTTEKYGIPSILLMENAAHAVARVITEKLGGSVDGRAILVLCGKGNNGGDGAALGRILALAGAFVEIIVFGKIEDIKGHAKINMDAAASVVDFVHNIESQEEWDRWFYNGKQRHDWAVIVDAILGTGLDRPFEIWLGTIVRHINILTVGKPELLRSAISIDIPSGLNSDLGNQIGEAFQADVTVTFTAPKAASVLAPASSLSGELVVANICSPYILVNEFA